MNQNRNRTYLGVRELREEAAEGSVGLFLPKADHGSKNW